MDVDDPVARATKRGEIAGPRATSHPNATRTRWVPIRARIRPPWRRMMSPRASPARRQGLKAFLKSRYEAHRRAAEARDKLSQRKEPRQRVQRGTSHTCSNRPHREVGHRDVFGFGNHGAACRKVPSAGTDTARATVLIAAPQARSNGPSWRLIPVDDVAFRMDSASAQVIESSQDFVMDCRAFAALGGWMRVSRTRGRCGCRFSQVLGQVGGSG